jgi:Arc/MetJ-type ribon-helix-helix transcriptional regulator
MILRSGQRVCTTERDTLVVVAQAISVRLDDEAIKALRALEASGMTRSEAIRTALVDASKRLRQRRDLAAEAAALEADEEDRAEMREVAAFMEFVRATR